MTPQTPPPGVSSDLPQDHPHLGHGGRYRFDPATGQTTLVSRAGQPDTAAPASPATPVQPQE